MKHPDFIFHLEKTQTQYIWNQLQVDETILNNSQHENDDQSIVKNTEETSEEILENSSNEDSTQNL